MKNQSRTFNKMFDPAMQQTKLDEDEQTTSHKHSVASTVDAWSTSVVSLSGYTGTEVISNDSHMLHRITLYKRGKEPSSEVKHSCNSFLFFSYTYFNHYY